MPRIPPTPAARCARTLAHAHGYYFAWQASERTARLAALLAAQKKKKGGTGAGAASLLDDIMGGIDMSQLQQMEPEPEPEKVVVVREARTNKISKQDQIDRMRALKRKQNAGASERAAAANALEKKEVDVTDAGPFGKTQSAKHAAVTEYLREKFEPDENVVNAVPVELPNAAVFSYKAASETGKFTPEQLMAAKGALPAGVNPRKRETYLTDEDFERTFNMSAAVFTSLPKWKRDKLKKSLEML